YALGWGVAWVRRGFRGGVHASLVSIILGFAFVGVAHAECAWVLWEEVTISRRAVGVPDVRWSSDHSWNILRIYDTGTSCRVDHSKLMSADSAWFATAGSRLTRINDGVYGEHTLEDGRAYRTERKRALCLPDTIDPRGAKGTRGDRPS